MNNNCPICNTESVVSNDGNRDAHIINCPRCGEFSISGTAEVNLKNTHLTDRQKANISGWLLDNQGYTIYSTDVDKLADLKAPSFTERADELLLYIASQTQYAGQPVMPNHRWISKAWCINRDELEAFRTFLYETGRLKQANTLHMDTITSQGWLRIEELSKTNIESSQGFVAMWFNPELRPIYDEVIYEAISDAGYKPHRVDDREHNDKVDDEIISQIRKSKFVVADFTGHRGGVYFEAGFAKGLGLEVFWLCREDDLENLHFDIRQYNCITWRNDKKDELKSRLKARIESVLGHGPKK